MLKIYILNQYYAPFIKKKRTKLYCNTFAGGFAFLIDFGTLLILTEIFHFHYLFSAGIAYIFGLIINYFLSVKWVFNRRIVKNRILELFVIIVIGLIGLALNQFFLWILTDILFVYYILSKIITSFIVYFWNFFARKIVLFHN